MPTTLSGNSWPKSRSLSLGAAGVLEVPSLRDPRYLIWGFQVFFFILGVEELNFLKSYATLGICLLTGGALDLVFVRIFHKRWALPQSGLVCAAGTALLLEASSPWLYAASVAIALGSKYVLRIEGRHVFNPTALGLVCTL